MTIVKGVGIGDSGDKRPHELTENRVKESIRETEHAGLLNYLTSQYAARIVRKLCSL